MRYDAFGCMCEKYNGMRRTYLQERILLLLLKLVRTEYFETAFRLCIVETVVVALKELEDVLDDDRF